MVVTHKGDIVHVQGPTHEYLLRSAGSHTHNVFAQACDALRPTLRAALRKAVREASSVTVPASVGHGEECRRVSVTAERLEGSPVTEGLILLSFQREDEAMAPSAASTASAAESVAAGDPQVRGLESELKRTRHELLRTIEQLEITNEELQASNEEGVAANEVSVGSSLVSMLNWTPPAP